MACATAAVELNALTARAGSEPARVFLFYPHDPTLAMPNSTEEYLPTSTNQAPQKVFHLARADDPVKYKILHLRTVVVENGSLTEGARLMFVRILDLAVQSSTYDDLGVVTIPQWQIAKRLGCSERTIFNWTRELVSAGILWLSEFKTNRKHPMHSYHVAEFDPIRSDERKKNGDWVGHPVQRRGPRARPRMVRTDTGKFCRLATETEQTPQVPDIAADDGKPLPLITETDCRSQRKALSAVSGKPLPLTTATDCRCQRKAVAAVSGKPLPLSAEKSCGHGEAKAEAEASLERGGESPPPSILEWEKKLAKMFPRELEAIKTELLSQLRAADPKNFTLREDINYRLEQVETQLFGRPVVRNKPARPAATVKTAPKALTGPELLQTAREAVAGGFANKLTDAQKNALRQAGEAS